MARRGSKKKLTRETLDPSSMKGYVERYLEWIQMLNYTERTVKNQRINLGYFLRWCEDRSISSPCEATRDVLTGYQRWLYNYRSESGKPLCFGSQVTRLTPIRGFFKWLSKNNHILYNPAADLDLPKTERRLPKHILNVREVEQVLGGVDVAGPLGIRDRAILETLYSTGIRRLELITLRIYDVDMERGTMLVHGKGRKDRTVPIGERALAWIEKYLRDARPQLSVEPDNGILFLTADGERLSENRLSELAGRYVAAAETGKTGACHLFRHTMATHMLEDGADIRYVQEMLGHEELNTTKKYTHISIRKLKEIHAKTHPGAPLPWESNQSEPIEAGGRPEKTTAEAFLCSLAAEDAEE